MSSVETEGTDTTLEDSADVQPEKLPDASREEIVWHMVSYSYERAFVIVG